MEDSILTSTKKLLGIAPSDDSFDLDILLNINSVLGQADQIMGPILPLTIVDATATWSEFNLSQAQLNMLKSYVYLKVKMVFDPDATSFTIEARAEQIRQLEFRMNVNREMEEHPLTPEPEEEVV